ncbi:DUF4386 domain-containing protein [Planococcus sp. YIM B11945]|uniref:DUF4386 domain-containing protein n=1 Tax=Planococcus sp. YIM B11945 TaxID=3435410 RepID=UPI003D7E1BD6
MASSSAEKPLAFYARVAGFSLLLVVVAGLFANVFVMGGLWIPDDAAATVNNITANELLFRFGILSFIIMCILDIVIAWALYVLLKQVNKNVALLAILFRIVFAAISSASLFNFLSVLQVLSNDAPLEANETNQIGLEVMAFIDAINNAGTIGLVFFSVHLLLLGYLIFKSGFIPKVFGILMLLSGLGYFIDNILWVLLANDTDLMAIFSLIVFVLAVIAELAFGIWLLVKGKKIMERMS